MQVNIIIHSAATVRFDEHLRKAVNINIIALQDLLKLSKELKNLKVTKLNIYFQKENELNINTQVHYFLIQFFFKSFVHISTAYSNCVGRKIVDETFYKPPISGDKLSQLMDSLDDDYITRITPS